MIKRSIPTAIYYFIVIICISFAIPTKAKDVKAAVGTSLAPYVIQQTNSGIELDIVREALAFNGHTLILRYPALKLVTALFNKKVVDAALTINRKLGINACLSDVVVEYQNYAITLKKSKQNITHLSDLQGKKVLAFQNAKLYLGRDFTEAVDQAQYSEVQQQTHQVNRLYKERDDVIISDKNIFLYYRSKVSNIDTSEELVFWPLFPPSPYRVAFHDTKLCKQFNEGLEHLRKTGRYTEIVNSYRQFIGD